MTDKKLIYILNHYSHDSSQHFYHVINLLRVIAESGVEIALVIEKCEDKPEFEHENILVICQKQKRKIFRQIELFSILRKLIKCGYNRIFIRITVSAAVVSILAARIFGAKTYYWQSGTTHEFNNRKKSLERFKWKLTSESIFSFIKRFTDYFVTGPEYMVHYYASTVGVKREKLLLLYNDIDLTRFLIPTEDEKKRLKQKFGYDNYSSVILMVHRLSPVRKTAFYIPFIVESSWLEERNAIVLIIGGGPDYDYIENRITESDCKDRIKLLGAKPNSQLHDYYKMADVFINPSYTEGFPRVLLEAMACGLPVVATNAGGTIDILGKNQQKYIVNKEDRDEFKDRLFELLNNPDELKVLSVENRNSVKKYSTEAVAKMYIEGIF